MTHIDGEKAGSRVMCALTGYIRFRGLSLVCTSAVLGTLHPSRSYIDSFPMCIGKLQDATPDISSYAFHLQSECLEIIILFVELHACLFFLFTFVISIVFALGALV